MPRKSPEVNAGSMADIAFLLLIFFLVTTTIETDSGINRKLPPMEDQIDPPIIKEKILINNNCKNNNQLLVEESLTDIKDLRGLAMDFLDNGGGIGEEACEYCQGERSPRSSDNPEKAIISLKNDRETPYKAYIAVQNELVAAYNELRNREFMKLYPSEGLTYFEADFIYNDPRTTGDQKEDLREKLSVVKKLYPQKLSEAEPSKVN